MIIDEYKRFSLPSGSDLRHDGKVEFAAVKPDWWSEADGLPVAIPGFLETFLKEVGYGTIPTALDGTGYAGSANIVVAPHQMAREFRRQRKLYKPRDNLGTALPFFMLDQDDYLVVEVGGRLDGCVTWSDDRERVVAKSLEEFFEGMAKNVYFHVGT